MVSYYGFMNPSFFRREAYLEITWLQKEKGKNSVLYNGMEQDLPNDTRMSTFIWQMSNLMKVVDVICLCIHTNTMRDTLAIGHSHIRSLNIQQTSFRAY